MKLARQLKLLLWKNFVLRRRQLVRLGVEITIPLILFLILAWVKVDRGLQVFNHQCHYDGKAMPSAGAGAFMQSFICAANNTCHENPTRSELAGIIENYNSSILSQVFYEIEELLGNRSDINAVSYLIEDLNTLQQVGRMAQNGTLNCSFSLGSVLVDPQVLQQQIASQNINLSQESIDRLLNASLNASTIVLLYEEYNELVNDPVQYGIKIVNLTRQISPEDLASQVTELPLQYLLGTILGPSAGTSSADSVLGAYLQLLNNSNLLALELRSRLCYENLTDYLFVLSDPASTQALTQSLCQLDVQDFQLLMTDVLQDLDLFKIIGQLERCSRTFGKNITYDEGTYDNQANIITELVQLDSLTPLFAAFNQTLQAARGYVNDTSTRDASSQFSRILCGRNNDILQMFQEEFAEVEDYVEENSQEEDQPLDYKYDDTTSKFCNDIFGNFEANPQGRLFWKQVKPLIRGKVPFTPNTPLVREILTGANATFAYFGSLKQFAKDWLQVSPDIVRVLATDSRVDTFRTVLLLAESYIAEREGNPAEDLYVESVREQWLQALSDTFGVELNDEERSLLQSVVDQQLTLLQTLVSSAGQRFNDSTLEQLKPMVNMLNTFLNNTEDPHTYTWRNFMKDVDSYMENIEKYLDCVELNKFEPFEDEFTLVNTSMQYIEEYKLWAGLVFDVDKDTAELPPHISFKIRQSVQMVDTTANNRVTDRFWRPGSRGIPTHGDLKYILNGFAFLQDMVEHSLIRMHTNLSEEEEIGIYVQQMPYPCYIYDRFFRAISRSMPMFMVLSWIYSCAMIVKAIVHEKEKRLKEVMKVMGLSNGVHWLAWFITSMILLTCTVFLLLIVLKVGKILEHSDPSVVLVFMLIFSVSTVMFCFMVSVFFSRANLAAASAGVLYFASYLPYSLCTRWEEYMTLMQKVAASLFNTVAFSYGCSYFSRYEEQGVGVQWHNIASSPLPEDQYNMLGCMFMMMIDSLIYGLITWYVEAVFPGQYGMPKRWYFFATKAYWCGTVQTKDGMAQSSMEMTEHDLDPDKFEKEPRHLPLGVCIQNLRKVYKRGQKVAVDGLSLNFYEGQITSFLGHNGAGKTTTMSILTGLYPPTEGTAFVYKKDIRMDMDQIRTNMGMCPQHNVLFDNLTVEEHIWFYASLKGMPEKDIKSEIANMVIDTGLQKKEKENAKNLSGGMKRKLSIALAFVGGSKVVILDEPTAGVDPYARRSIWDLLLKYKPGRTIILSTHFMDEADVLGDRIAIISQGKLCFCGSSLFLKSQVGSGYYLTLVKQEVGGVKRKTGQDSDEEEEDNLAHIKFEIDDGGGDMKFTPGDTEAASTDSCDAAHVTGFICKYVPGAELKENIGSELTYQLPDDEDAVARFENLFKDLDSNLEYLGISSYGISNTTLEEVFLKIAEDTHVDEDLSEEAQRQRLEQCTDGGTYARPVTHRSFRRKRAGFLGLKRVNSEQRELLDADAQSDSVYLPLLEFFDTGSVDGFESEEGGDGYTVEQCTGAGTYRIQGYRLIAKQFMALFIKRIICMLRSKKGFVAQILLPAVFICLAMLFTKLTPSDPVEPPLELHPWHLQPQKFSEDNLFTFLSNDDSHLKWTKDIEELFQSKPGIGTRCMNPDYHAISGYDCEEEVDGRELQWTEVSGVAHSLDCSCDTGAQVCPQDAAGPEPSKRLLFTTDYLYNVTGRDLSDWLLKTTEQYIKRRYGGFSVGELNTLFFANISTIDHNLQRLVNAANGGADLDLPTVLPPLLQELEILLGNFVTKQNAKVWFNNKGYISMVAYMNAINNFILRMNLPEAKDRMKYGITVINHPVNRTRAQLASFTMSTSWIDVLISIAVIFAMSSIPAYFVVFLIQERVSGSKHLQFVSGVNPAIYWLTNFTWDICNYILACIICICIFLMFQVRAYVSPDNIPCLIALLLLYGWSITPLMYPSSFFFSVSSTAYVALQCANLCVGFITTIATFILEVLALQGDEELFEINKILRQVFLIFPQYCLGRGLIDMTRNQIIADAYSSFGEDYYENPFSWHLVGRNILALAIQGCIFLAFTLLMEYGFFSHELPFMKPKSEVQVTSSSEDVDVIRERQRVVSGDTHSDVMIIQGLRKVYRRIFKKNIKAVKDIYAGVHKGECFGLLGVNGAGKTSTFKMLTGDVLVTSGDAHIAGHSIRDEMVKVRQHLGYCPQFDALCGLLTGKEHLEFYARLRGVPEKEVKVVANWGIKKLGLIRYAKKQAADYSGGNKRKLSTAISLVGNPSVIFLDEPTTGMDPHARRFLWNCIAGILRDGRSVILTSHSMEECETLCNRLAIMVNGEFKCLGSVQHLKNRFGGGYTVILRVSGEIPQLQPVIDFFSLKFPGSVLKERHNNMLQYHIGADKFSLSHIFGSLESVRQRLNIENYSVSQTTLDQVFINFASEQHSDDVDNPLLQNTETGHAGAQEFHQTHTTGAAGNNSDWNLKVNQQNILIDNQHSNC